MRLSLDSQLLLVFISVLALTMAQTSPLTTSAPTTSITSESTTSEPTTSEPTTSTPTTSTSTTPTSTTSTSTTPTSTTSESTTSTPTTPTSTTSESTTSPPTTSTPTTSAPSTSAPTTLSDVRLVDGFSSCSGRLEILHNGIWGTVCDDYWDSPDAAVVCRQLGCGNVVQALNYNFGQGSGQIWLDDVQCSGNELALQNCTSLGWGIHNCGHNEDVGLICEVNIIGLQAKLSTFLDLADDGNIQIVLQQIKQELVKKGLSSNIELELRKVQRIKP